MEVKHSKWTCKQLQMHSGSQQTKEAQLITKK